MNDIDREWAEFVGSAKAEDEHIKNVSRTAEAIFVAVVTPTGNPAILAGKVFEAALAFHEVRRVWVHEFTTAEARKRAERREKEGK